MKQFVPLLLFLVSATSQAQSLASVELGALFLESTIKSHAEVCQKRILASREPWALALNSWQARNKDKLDQLRALGSRLEERYQRQENDPFKLFPSPLLTLALQQTVLSMSSLAGANDGEAASMCDGLLALLSDERFNSLNLERVSKTVEAILSRPSR